jgi:hypothetical protein
MSDQEAQHGRKSRIPKLVDSENLHLDWSGLGVAGNDSNFDDTASDANTDAPANSDAPANAYAIDPAPSLGTLVLSEVRDAVRLYFAPITGAVRAVKKAVKVSADG